MSMKSKTPHKAERLQSARLIDGRRMGAGQRALVKAIVEDGIDVYSTRLELYADLNSQIVAVGSPIVQAAVVQELRSRIVTQDATMARIVAKTMLNDGNTPAATRWAIAKDFMKAGGLLPREDAKPQSANSGKSLGEMSGNELRQHIADLEREIQERQSASRVIDADTLDAPKDDTLDANILKYLD